MLRIPSSILTVVTDVEKKESVNITTGSHYTARAEQRQLLVQWTAVNRVDM